MVTSEPDHPLRFYNPAAFAFDTEVAIALIADMQIRRAIDRGDFDDLPGSGKPLDLPARHDPHWWLNNLMKREGIIMLPPSIQLRKDDAALDEHLDGLPNERDVRHEIEQFNERVIRARYQLPAGPPLITMPRDIDATVTAWADRRAAKARAATDGAGGRDASFGSTSDRWPGRRSTDEARRTASRKDRAERLGRRRRRRRRP